MGETGEVADQMAEVRALATSGLHYSYRAKSRARTLQNFTQAQNGLFH